MVKGGYAAVTEAPPEIELVESPDGARLDPGQPDGERFGNGRELEAGFLSRVTWSWLNSLISFGHRQPLEMEDLAPLSPCDTSAELQRRWDANWARGETSVVRALRRTVGFHMYVAGGCKLVGDLLGFCSPLLLHALVSFVESPGSMAEGAVLALLFLCCTVLQSLFLHQHHHLVIREAMHARAITTNAVFRKMLKLSPATVQAVTSGKIQNFTASDAESIKDCLYFIHYLWAAPLQIVVALFLAVHFLGLSALAGFGVMVLLVPLQSLLSTRLQRLSRQALAKTDARVGLVSEILQSIRTVKFYAWEEPWAAELTRVRDEELRFFLVRRLVQAASSLLLQSGPVLVSLTSFAVYTLTEDAPLTASQVFTSLALFNILRMPLSIMPVCIGSTISAHVSTKRLAEFYQLDELEPVSRTGGGAVRVADASYRRDGKDEDLVFSGLSLAVAEGALVVVLGPVGAGKSTLVDALLGDLVLVSGTAEVRGRVAYVAQQPWVVHGTVRDNVLMGRPFDEERYRAVMSACALDRDLEILVDGDMSVVGESGLNLSGGQKARLGLARAVYSDADVCIFDDPLAALDAEVAAAVFETALCGPLLAGKTRILVTNKQELAAAADQVVVLEGMRIVSTTAQAPAHGRPAAAAAAASTGIADEDGKKGRDAVEDEGRNVGSVSGSVYLEYLRLCGLGGCALVLLLSLLRQAATTGGDVWLSEWTDHADDDAEQMTFYLEIYGLLSFGSVVVIAATQTAVAVTSVRGARTTHERLLDSVLHAPVSFFDATPTGRLVNRFAADTAVVDRQVGTTFGRWVAELIQISGACLVQLTAAWWMVFPGGLLLVVYRRLAEYYRCTSRELQRLDSVSKSPIFVHFGQTLGGLPSLRAYELQAPFCEQMAAAVDNNNRAFWTNNLCNRWLGIRLEGLGSLMLFTTSLAIVVSAGSISAGVAGLVLSYALQLTGTLNWCVRSSILLETNLNAVERISEYSALEREGALCPVIADPPATWGAGDGGIEFRDVCARYRPDLPLVIKHLSFRIAPGEKVGVVGRTGCGKSSLMMLLLRIVEAESGIIFVDGVDTSNVALSRLRSLITIIPQLPVLFTGTVRFNLDPFDDCTDDELWDALQRVGLRDAVGSLEDAVVEGGENFSVGQRQLFSLARAVLRQARILLLDEATASVDSATDSLVQTMIRSRFQRATTLTIAHRINTILDSDRVLVLGDGEVLEFDSPAALQSRPGGVFESLVRESGLSQ